MTFAGTCEDSDLLVVAVRDHDMLSDDEMGVAVLPVSVDALRAAAEAAEGGAQQEQWYVVRETGKKGFVWSRTFDLRTYSKGVSQGEVCVRLELLSIY